jgi:hypothetical protein
MSAVPLSIPTVPAPRAPTPRAAAVTIQRPGTMAQPAAAPVNWRLTDRGIAVVMVVGVLILTAALLVIGLTAVSVTSPDYGLQESRQTQH